MKYKLLHAEEKYIPHYGLRVDAVYQMNPSESILCFPRKIRFWNRHAPVELEADLVEVKFDVPHMWCGKNGFTKRTASGHPMITQCEVLFCPKTIATINSTSDIKKKLYDARKAFFEAYSRYVVQC